MTRAVYTVEEAAKQAKQAEKQALVEQLHALLPTLHPHVLRYDAEPLLASIDTWTPQELAPMLRKMVVQSTWRKRWDTLTPEERDEQYRMAYRALYHADPPPHVDVLA